MKIFILITFVAAAFFLQGSEGTAIKYNYVKDLDNTTNFGAALKMFYTAFQGIMPCGYKPLKIPVLAPFSLKHYDVNLISDHYNIVGSISNVLVTGLDNFQILSSSFNTTTNRTTFDVIFPEVRHFGEYEIDFMVHLAGIPIKTAGKGLINVKTVDFRMVGDFILAPLKENPNSAQVKDFNLNFYIGNIINNNWNTLWDISFNNFINKMGSEVTLMWAQQVQVRLQEMYNQYLLPVINSKLNNMSMSEITNFLIFQSKKFDMANCTSTLN